MRTSVLRLTVACLLGTAACFGMPTEAAPFPDDAPPTVFEVRVSGFGFGAHDVTLRGDTLVVVRTAGFHPDSSRTTRVVPTRAEWAAFWRAAEAAGLRSWPRECKNTDVVDGGGFTLRIVYADGSVEALGVNSFPQRDGRCSRDAASTAEYLAFTNAVSTLIRAPFP